jgi:hypothetical protein
MNEATMAGVNNKFLLKEIKAEKKEQQFEKYLDNLSITGGKSFTDTINLLNGFKSGEAKEFAKGLALYKTIEALSGNFNKHRKGLGDVIFDQAQVIGKGIGPGELWISWLVEGARVSGGGESFDITVNDKEKYEVKSYIGDNAPFRLGNAGAASKFQWLKHMRALATTTETIVSIKGLEASQPELFTAAKLVNSRAEKSSSADFARGEISKTLLGTMVDFIKVAQAAVESRKSGYDIIEIKSTQAGMPNKTYHIEPASASDIANSSFKVIGEIDTKDLQSETVLFRELVKNKYVREGVAGLVKDINVGITQVEQKYKGIKFLVFRTGGMNISSDLMKVELSNPDDLASVYGGAKAAVFHVSGAILRVREQI